MLMIFLSIRSNLDYLLFPGALYQKDNQFLYEHNVLKFIPQDEKASHPEIPYLYFRFALEAKYSKEPIDFSRKLIIFSHGNGENLYSIFKHRDFVSCAQEWEADILVYEYPGYYQNNQSNNYFGDHPNNYSTDRTTFESIRTHAVATYNYARDKLGFSAGNIILYGYSIGSAPTLALVDYSSKRNEQVGGVIIQSGFTTIFGTLISNRNVAWILKYPIMLLEFLLVPDAWNNEEIVSHVPQNLSIAFVHGIEDTIISKWHSQQMYEKCPSHNKELSLIPSATHTYFPGKSMSITMDNFLSDIEFRRVASDWYKIFFPSRETEPSSFDYSYLFPR